MKAASAALLLIVAVRGVSARAEASKIMRQKAVEICENTSAFLDSRNSCLKAIATTNQLDDSALGSCAELGYPSGRLECLRDVIGKVYSFEDKKACFDYLAPSSRAECFRRRGVLSAL